MHNTPITANQLQAVPEQEYLQTLEAHGLEWQYKRAYFEAAYHHRMFNKHSEHPLLAGPLDIKFRQLFMTDDAITLMRNMDTQNKKLREDFKMALSAHGISSENQITHAVTMALNFVDKHPELKPEDFEVLSEGNRMKQVVSSILQDADKAKHLVPQLKQYNAMVEELKNRAIAAADGAAKSITLMVSAQIQVDEERKSRRDGSDGKPPRPM